MKDYREVIIIIEIIMLLALLIMGVERLKSRKALNSPGRTLPFNLVTTFKGNPGTSRAFTWHTLGSEKTGWLELVQGHKATFSSAEVLRLQARSITIDTYKHNRTVHKVEVTGLKPGTEYTYRVGSGVAEEWSTPSQFSTEATEGDQVVFLNVTDSQGTSEADFKLWGRTLEQALRTFPQAHFIVHNGDLTDNPEDVAGWDVLFGKVKSRVSKVPFMPVIGNHDEVSGDADRYASHFNLPCNGAKGSNAGTTYSFDYGPVHVTVLNTESNLKNQTQWLKKDLADTDKKWTIVAMHRPAYGRSFSRKLEEWTRIFDYYGVDLVLQGHNHEYSRSYPLRAGAVVPEERTVKGVVYVVTNTAGGKFNDMKEDQFYHEVHFQNYKPMFAAITIKGSVLTYEAYDVDGVKLDELVLRH
ncbi:metallophosphoesterase [Paenibacillus sp. sgz500958]|uniref:metallophosphoesterase n=1 Tax=Paenibacillus sp. sgz500958 TaxID=3242475 RepID=UPI0036D262A9